jgi:hypothetical protein
MTTIFTVNDFDRSMILKITERAGNLADELGVPLSGLTTLMDLSAAQNSTPMRLQDLLNFGDPDFAHDVWGISRHINRETGQLEDCFLPRCARYGDDPLIMCEVCGADILQSTATWHTCSEELNGEGRVPLCEKCSAENTFPDDD